MFTLAAPVPDLFCTLTVAMVRSCCVTNKFHQSRSRPIAKGTCGGSAPQIFLGPEKFVLNIIVKAKIVPP